MKDVAVRIYDWMSGHRWWCLASFVVVTLLMVLSVTRLSYKEDIRDFLPLDEEERTALNDYDRQAQTSLIVAIIEQRDSTIDDPDLLVESVETFIDAISDVEGLTVQSVLSQMEERQEDLYRQLPFLLEAEDYQRMDSLLRQPEFVASKLQKDKERLLMPMGSMMAHDITHDPLGLFSPVLSLLRDTTVMDRFDLYDGCLLTADHRRALVMMSSPYGGSETASNERLLEVLKVKADSVSSLLTPHSSLLTSHSSLLEPPLSIRFCGAPVIAVTNASQIKTDSLISVSIAVVLILLLLWFFLRSLRNILLIAFSIGWGWVFAVACLSWVHQEVSVIVIGISSIIVGIAINYPLHLIAHLSHTHDVRQALKEVVKPLVVGNITTVGAFFALVPLRAAALRDLGLFSSFLLVGTILFTIIWLPQVLRFKFTVDSLSSCVPSVASGNAECTNDDSAVSERLASQSTVNRKLSTVNNNTHWLIAAILLLTAFFGYHSLHTTFDADLTHINYMTPAQRTDMALLQQLMPTDTQRQQDLNDRLPSTPEAQQDRLRLWQSWTSSHHDQLQSSLRQEADRIGFAPDSFDPFFALLSPSSEGLANISSVNRQLSTVNRQLSTVNKNPFASIATHLSDDFNYIGWTCACIVFFFLWASFRSLPLALLSFLPMAVSWLWILGIMALLGIQFNIINIILSTFIFGQGDDYTIFMTEGTVYEYTHRRPMLASYRRAIILSALIMFIGIGSLITARHPALHSLAEVTIVGMFSVVLMAFVIPPVVFHWFVRFRKTFSHQGNHL